MVDSVAPVTVTVDARASSRPALRNIRWSVALAAVVIGLNLSVMSVAVADLRSSFPTAKLSFFGWVVSAYTIVFGAVLVPAGGVADRLGRRRVFLTGLGTFAVGSLLAGTAPVLPLLILGRVVQGIGAACIMPAAIAMLLDATPVGERAAASAFYGGVSATGAAAGPSVGAFVVDATSWRLAFFLGLPFLLAAALVGRRSLPRTVPSSDAALPDVIGALMLMAAMAGISFGIGQGPPWGWTHPGVVGAFGASAVLVPVFVWRCARHRSPVIPVRLLRRRSFAGANVAALLLGAASGGAGLANVLFLRDVWGFRLLTAGLAGLPSSVASVLAARPAGRYAVRYSEVVVGAPAIFCVAIANVWLRLFADNEPNYLFGYLPATLLSGAGIGAASPMIATAVVRGVGAAELSLASASTRSFLQLGNAIGIAVVVALLAGPALSLDDYHTLWTLLAVFAVACSVAIAAIGRPPRGPTTTTDGAPPAG